MNLRDADFSDATWDHVHLIDCDLTRARFAGLRVHRVHLQGCDLSGISGIDSLRGARLGRTDAISALEAMADHLGIQITEGDL